jgi:hypothetical protein
MYQTLQTQVWLEIELAELRKPCCPFPVSRPGHEAGTMFFHEPSDFASYLDDRSVAQDWVEHRCSDVPPSHGLEEQIGLLKMRTIAPGRFRDLLHEPRAVSIS